MKNLIVALIIVIFVGDLIMAGGLYYLASNKTPIHVIVDKSVNVDVDGIIDTKLNDPIRIRILPENSYSFDTPFIPFKKTVP